VLFCSKHDLIFFFYFLQFFPGSILLLPVNRVDAPGSGGFSSGKMLKSEIAIGEFWRISDEKMITSNFIALREKY